MTVVGKLCRNITALTAEQIALLDNISQTLTLAADLAHAQVTVYAKARSDKFMVIIDQTKPNTSFIQYKPNLLGTTVHATEEPLLWRTITSGCSINGQREWALGMCIDMQTFPVWDNDKTVIAAVSFETTYEESRAEGHGILVDGAYRLLIAKTKPAEAHYYRALAASDGIIVVDERETIIFANPPAASIYKVLGVGQLVGRRITERKINMRLGHKAHSSQNPCETQFEVGNITLEQRAIPIVINDQTVRTIVIISDVTELKKKEKELLIKSAVIQEIHHRVKNNLQTIASLLRLQARRTESAEVKAALRESVNRILSISVVHEFLSQQDAEYIDVAEVAKNILDLVIQNMLEPDFNLQTVFNGNTVILPSEQASSLALVINELIQNSIEHGFIGREEGIIGIDIATFPDSYQIKIYDNGIGIPQNFNPQTSKSLGLQIVRTLIESDVGGSFKLYADKGTHACITIPRSGKEEGKL
ncbi:MAG: histidine kinase N-terminal domain-containing protein [Veillonellales bacterium]